MYDTIFFFFGVKSLNIYYMVPHKLFKFYQSKNIKNTVTDIFYERLKIII